MRKHKQDLKQNRSTDTVISCYFHQLLEVDREGGLSVLLNLLKERQTYKNVELSLCAEIIFTFLHQLKRPFWFSHMLQFFKWGKRVS